MSRKPEKLIEPINADFDEVARAMASPKKPEITESRKPEKKRVQKKSDFPPSPFAKYAGELHLGNSVIDCYVLDTKERVISLRATVKSIAQTDPGRLDEYIGMQALKPFINNIPGRNYRTSHPRYTTKRARNPSREIS